MAFMISAVFMMCILSIVMMLVQYVSSRYVYIYIYIHNEYDAYDARMFALMIFMKSMLLMMFGMCMVFVRRLCV